MTYGLAVRPRRRGRGGGRGRATALIGIAIGILALCGAGLLAARALPVRGGGGFVLLSVRETGNLSLAAFPQTPRQAIFRLREGERVLSLSGAPPNLRGARVVVLWEVEAEDQLLHQELVVMTSLPDAVPLAGELVWNGLVPTEGGLGEPIPINLIANANRILAGDLSVLSAGRDGQVTVSYGGRNLVMEAGSSWGEARQRAGGADRVIEAGPDWEREIRLALAEGQPVTRLEIINYGIWRKRQIQAERGGTR
jgi:hypothetical protein